VGSKTVITGQRMRLPGSNRHRLSSCNASHDQSAGAKPPDRACCIGYVELGSDQKGVPEGKVSFRVWPSTPFVRPLRFDRQVIEHKLTPGGDQVNHDVADPRVASKVLDVAAVDEHQVEGCLTGQAVLPAISNHRRPTISTQ